MSVNYIATEALDRLRTEDNNFLVTEDSGSGTTTTTTTTTTPAPVLCLPIGTYISGINFKVYSTTTGVASGYVHATPIVCNVILPTGPSVNPVDVLNNFSLIVSFGNGVVTEITQVTDSTLTTEPVTYDWPGAYEVKLSVVPKNGCPVGTFTKVFSAFNYLTDSISWDYSNWSELTSAALVSGALYHGYQSCVPGPLENPRALTILYSTTNRVSSDVAFDLYSENSLSQPWELATTNNKFAQLRPRWRFTDLDNNIVSSLSDADPTAVYINEFGTRVDPESGTLVGYTGTIDFYYIDDIPSLSYSFNTGYSVQVPRLWLTYNTLVVPNFQDNNDGYAPSYSNSKVQLSADFYVKCLSADHFNVTLNGGSIPLPGVLWPSTDNNFIVTINSGALSSTEFTNKNLLNHPLIGGVNPSISATIAPVIAASVESPVFSIQRYDNLNRDTGGFYKNALTTLSLSSAGLSAGVLTGTLILSAVNYYTLIEPPPYAGNYTASTRISQASTYGAVSGANLSGYQALNITDFNKKYFVRKINENFNYGEQLYKYALQPFIAANNNLFKFLSAAAGDNVHPDENFGTVTYEKIANFVANNNDIYTANVDQLYSLANLINTEFDNFNLNPPPVLKRNFDLYSTPHERLWGNREKYNTNFNVLTDHTNLGVELTAYNINTAIVSAGQKIVLNDIYYSNFYELLEVPIVTSYASVTARGLSAYFSPTATYPLSSYPLSSFFGWGVKTPVKDNYRFYYYDAQFTNTPVNNLIDWNTRTEGLSTTLSETASSIDDWYKDGGILENIYSYYITKGLGLTD